MIARDHVQPPIYIDPRSSARPSASGYGDASIFIINVCINVVPPPTPIRANEGALEEDLTE